MSRAIEIHVPPEPGAAKYRFNVNGTQQDVPAGNLVAVSGLLVLSSVLHLALPVSGSYSATVQALDGADQPIGAGVSVSGSTVSASPDAVAVCDRPVQNIDDGGVVVGGGGLAAG